jgi:hypothetical protein
MFVVEFSCGKSLPTRDVPSCRPLEWRTQQGSPWKQPAVVPRRPSTGLPSLALCATWNVPHGVLARAQHFNRPVLTVSRASIEAPLLTAFGPNPFHGTSHLGASCDVPHRAPSLITVRDNCCHSQLHRCALCSARNRLRSSAPWRSQWQRGAPVATSCPVGGMLSIEQTAVRRENGPFPATTLIRHWRRPCVQPAPWSAKPTHSRPHLQEPQGSGVL